MAASIAFAAVVLAACGQTDDAPVVDGTVEPEATQAPAPVETPMASDSDASVGQEASAAEEDPQASQAETVAPDDVSDEAAESVETLAGRIAYVTPDLKIRTVNPDGTEDRLLTAGQGRYSWPTWAPDGVHIAFPGSDRRGRSC